MVCVSDELSYTSLTFISSFWTICRKTMHISRRK